jgi:phage gpG-like protein
MRFTFEIDGIKEFDRSFNRVEEHIKDLRPVWDAVERTFYDIEKEQFASEGSAGRGGKWKALSPAYLKRKEKQYPGTKILERTGKMRDALTQKTGDTVLVKTPDEFGIGTSLPYAGYHQRGGKRLPKREIVSFSDDNRRTMQKAMQKEFLTIMRKDGQIKLDVKDE